MEKELEREISIKREEVPKYSCGACDDYKILNEQGHIRYNYKVVNVILIGGMEIRLCNKCKKELVKLLKNKKTGLK